MLWRRPLHRAVHPARRGSFLPLNTACVLPLEAQIEAFIDYYNHRRYHERINNLIPADVYFGRRQAILKQPKRIKRKTMETPRLQSRKYAA